MYQNTRLLSSSHTHTSKLTEDNELQHLKGFSMFISIVSLASSCHGSRIYLYIDLWL